MAVAWGPEQAHAAPATCEQLAPDGCLCSSSLAAGGPIALGSCVTLEPQFLNMKGC